MTLNNFKILDCTLRDGGYYTNWDFDETLIETYAEAMESLPIDFVEVGYRSIPMNGYLGQYFYCPEYVLKKLKSLMPTKELVIILNEKDIRVTHIKEGLLNSCKPYVSMVRLAIDPKNMERAIDLAKEVKAAGFKVAFNVMYMSNWKAEASFLDYLVGVEEVIDYFYMVDSYGGIMPDDVKATVELVRSKTSVPLGFHGHNNLEMALINSITAINAGCQILDATITGMGRGAGNLKTELLLTYLSKFKEWDIVFNNLSVIVSDFEELKNKHDWGTNLPYMVSGINSLPQKKVMDWITKRAYSINSIVQALQNQKDNVSDNLKLSNFKESRSYKKAIIIGGGKSAKDHSKAVREYITQNKDNICVIHASSKNASFYRGIEVSQFFCLIGNEGFRLNKVFDGELDSTVHKCVLPPYPRTMGTFVPEKLKSKAFELSTISFIDKFLDSHFTLAIETALELNCIQIQIVGFDGYDENITQKEHELAAENNYILSMALKKDIDIVSITQTKYNVPSISVYSFL